jgi:hypothetical protein
MTRKINSEDFDKQINRLLSEGWNIDHIEKVEYYKVELSKESGQPIYKTEGKIPLLKLLNQPMIIKLCQILNVKYTGRFKHELVEELENKYTKGVILTAYDSILKLGKKNKQLQTV